MRSISRRAARLALPIPERPRLRGVLHQYAFFVSLFCGVGLILAASAGRARLAATIYAAAVSALLGTSALYHRVSWRPAEAARINATPQNSDTKNAYWCSTPRRRGFCGSGTASVRTRLETLLTGGRYR